MMIVQVVRDGQIAYSGEAVEEECSEGTVYGISSDDFELKDGDEIRFEGENLLVILGLAAVTPGERIGVAIGDPPPLDPEHPLAGWNDQ